MNINYTNTETMENFNRLVIDLYRKCFDDFKAGNEMDIKMLTEAQNNLNFAIDHAKVINLPSDELEALKNDINHLKYELA